MGVSSRQLFNHNCIHQEFALGVKILIKVDKCRERRSGGCGRTFQSGQGLEHLLRGAENEQEVTGSFIWVGQESGPLEMEIY